MHSTPLLAWDGGTAFDGPCVAPCVSRHPTTDLASCGVTGYLAQQAAVTDDVADRGPQGFSGSAERFSWENRKRSQHAPGVEILAEIGGHPDGPYVYDAFISYRCVDRDRKWAEWLIEALEGYRVPLPLQDKGLPPRLKKVFRDTDEAPAASDLNDAIKQALIASRFLIVVCSPYTPRSKWVEREIRMFNELGRGDRVLALLTEGEPSDSFPGTSARASERGRRCRRRAADGGGEQRAACRGCAAAPEHVGAAAQTTCPAAPRGRDPRGQVRRPAAARSGTREEKAADPRRGRGRAHPADRRQRPRVLGHDAREGGLFPAGDLALGGTRRPWPHRRRDACASRNELPGRDPGREGGGGAAREQRRSPAARRRGTRPMGRPLRFAGPCRRRRNVRPL